MRRLGFFHRFHDGIDRYVVVRFGFRIATACAEAHLDPLGTRGRDVLANVVWPNRERTMPAIDQYRQLARRWTPALPDRRHRALHGPSAVNHVVDQDYLAVFDVEILGAVDGMECIVRLIDVERCARRKNFGLRSDQFAQAKSEHRATTDYADNRDARHILNVRDDLVGERFDCANDFHFVHYFALRTALVRFVSAFLGLFHAVEHRQRAFFDPLLDVALQIFIEAIVPMRPRMTDVFGFQFAFAVTALQRKHGGIDTSAERESRREVAAFESRDAVQICASRRRLGLETNRLRERARTRA